MPSRCHRCKCRIVTDLSRASRNGCHPDSLIHLFATEGLGAGLAMTVPYPGARIINLSRRQHPAIETVIFDLTRPETYGAVADAALEPENRMEKRRGAAPSAAIGLRQWVRPAPYFGWLRRQVIDRRIPLRAFGFPRDAARRLIARFGNDFLQGASPPRRSHPVS